MENKQCTACNANPAHYEKDEFFLCPLCYLKVKGVYGKGEIEAALAVNDAPDTLSKYERFSDTEIHSALVECDPRMRWACAMLAEMQVMMGYTDEDILSKLRESWPSEERDLWDYGDEFRGKLVLRAVHHVASQLRTRATNAPNN